MSIFTILLLAYKSSMTIYRYCNETKKSEKENFILTFTTLLIYRAECSKFQVSISEEIQSIVELISEMSGPPSLLQNFSRRY